MPFFLGIDGGGTKTRCLVGDDQAVLGTGSGAGCNLLRVGEACTQDSLASAIHEACVAANVSPKQIARTCAGISGAADNGIASMVQRLMNDIVGGAIEVIGDMEVALEGAFQGGPGVIVIGGTGSIAYGRNSRGEQARAGGWGRVISDEGSGHWIAIRALSAAMRQRDRAEKSDLLNALMVALEVRIAEDLVVRLNSDPIRDYASLFPVVLASAGTADETALKVLRSAGRELANLAGVVIQRLFSSSEAVSVATHGGVLASSPVVKKSFQQEVRRLFANADCVEHDVDPALGALQRARREFGIWHHS